ncbi:hypothetical protein SH601_03265 [Gracilibacillus sp. S3-1-1]|uniref:Uncharacterized protein n=1 Tax=Gracilibacillus pellucidus TaxID=3095368 RepID=A0ACC6M221_9BACI|nr:hypothetical protein [Gracilibacillus sp. S3-1-1]MDX8044995.1 hypothetical protein [Gracilibacillus sp. S3-1-1]
MKTRMKIILSVVGVVLLMMLFIHASESYFRYKEISLASEKCIEDGGYPKVETYSSNDYSFSCETPTE